MKSRMRKRGLLSLAGVGIWIWIGVLSVVGIFLGHEIWITSRAQWISDVDEDRMAGTVENQSGKVVIRKTSGFSKIEEGDSVQVGTLFRLNEDSELDLRMRGNWFIELKGEGDFYLKEAITNQHSVHRESWKVTSGSFQAIPKPYEPLEKSDLSVETPDSEILIHGGQFGIRIGPKGKGQLWLMSGEGQIKWKGGKQKWLSAKKPVMEFL